MSGAAIQRKAPTAVKGHVTTRVLLTGWFRKFGYLTKFPTFSNHNTLYSTLHNVELTFLRATRNSRGTSVSTTRASGEK